MSKRETQPPEAPVEECRGDAPSGPRIRIRRQLVLKPNANFPSNFHLPTTTSFVMLRLTVLAARPLGLGKSATVTLRPVVRNFNSFGSKTTTNYFNAASNRSRASPSSFWSKCSRTFMTDSSAVTVRPTQAEAWKKYAVTAVGLHRAPSNCPRSAHQTCLGYCRWDDHRH